MADVCEMQILWVTTKRGEHFLVGDNCDFIEIINSDVYDVRYTYEDEKRVRRIYDPAEAEFYKE